MNSVQLERRRDALRSVLMRDMVLRLFTAMRDAPVEVRGSGYAPIPITLADWVFDDDGLAANCRSKTFLFDAPIKLKVLGCYLTRPGSEVAFQAETFPEPVEILRTGESIEIETVPMSVRGAKTK